MWFCISSLVLLFFSVTDIMSAGGKNVTLLLGSEDALRHEIVTLRVEISRLHTIVSRHENTISTLRSQLTSSTAEASAQPSGSSSLVHSDQDLLTELRIINGQLSSDLSRKQDELSEADLLITRLRGTKELMSVELAKDDFRIKSLISSLNHLERQIESQGTCERERSHLYEQLRSAFQSKCQAERDKASASTPRGDEIERRLNVIISKFSVDLLPPAHTGVAESLAQARQNITSLVNKAKQIILHVETGSAATPVEAEEELVIRVKRKRASDGLYTVTAETLPVVTPAPPPTDDLSDDISCILQEFRSNTSGF